MVLGLAIAIMLLVAVPASYASTSFVVTYNQVQFQWRANKAKPFGEWSVVYPTYAGHTDFDRTGNALHASFEYQPSPFDVQGASHVFVYDKKQEVWILKEGTVTYTSLASGLPITEYFRGYVKFSGEPSPTTFEFTVEYQWAYVYGVDEETVKTKYPKAWWDETMGAWLCGFSIYLQDPTVIPPPPILFPTPFIEPVPASNYNPLGLPL